MIGKSDVRKKIYKKKIKSAIKKVSPKTMREIN